MGDMADWIIDNDPWINGEYSYEDECQCIPFLRYHKYYIDKECILSNELILKFKENYLKGDFIA